MIYVNHFTCTAAMLKFNLEGWRLPWVIEKPPRGTFNGTFNDSRARAVKAFPTFQVVFPY